MAGIFITSGKIHSCPWHLILEMPFWCKHSSVVPGESRRTALESGTGHETPYIAGDGLEEMCQLYISKSDIGIPQSKNVRIELPTKHRHPNAGDGCVKTLWGSSQDESLSCTAVSRMALDACLLSVPSHKLSVL